MGQQAAWPVVSMIETRCKIEHTLDRVAAAAAVVAAAASAAAAATPPMAGEVGPGLQSVAMNGSKKGGITRPPMRMRRDSTTAH